MYQAIRQYAIWYSHVSAADPCFLEYDTVLIGTYQHVWGDYCEDLDYPEDGDRKINRSVDKFFLYCVHTVHFCYVLFIYANKCAFFGTNK
jgi:hypothetical protein